jgi:hypothetical protein
MDGLHIPNQAVTCRVYGRTDVWGQKERERDGESHKLDRNRLISNPCFGEEEENLLYIFLQSFFHVLPAERMNW